jgi:pimeloyl-ACP methyl ester carboxylesterase
MHGDADVNIPVDDARALHAARPSAELAVVRKARHNFDGSAAATLVGIVTRFVAREVGAVVAREAGADNGGAS